MVPDQLRGGPRGSRRGGGAASSTGIATVAEVFLNGELVLESESMFAEHAIDVGALPAGRERAGDPLPRAGPAARASGASRARAGARGSSARGTCASSARCCSAAPRASRRDRRPSAPGGRCACDRRRGRGAGRPRAAHRGSMATTASLDVRARVRALGGELPTAIEAELTGPSGTHRATLALSAADGDARRHGRAAGARASRAGGRTPTATRPCTRSGWSISTAAGTRSVDGGQRRLPHGGAGPGRRSRPRGRRARACT